MAEDLGSKLRATAEQARQEKKLLGDKLDKLQARYKKKVPFDDMVVRVSIPYSSCSWFQISPTGF